MNNDELSAKVADLRGERWFYMHGDAAYCSRCNWCIGYPADGDKIYNCESCNANEREGGKNYAEDMNAALELIREMQAAGLIVNVEFQAESQEPYDDRWTMAQVWTVERVKVDGIRQPQPQPNELLVECWECSWFNPAVAICKAYIEWREQQCQQ
jgi:hypothetical protein